MGAILSAFFLLFLLLHSQFYLSSCSLGPYPAPVSFFSPSLCDEPMPSVVNDRPPAVSSCSACNVEHGGAVTKAPGRHMSSHPTRSALGKGGVFVLSQPQKRAGFCSLDGGFPCSSHRRRCGVAGRTD